VLSELVVAVCNVPLLLFGEKVTQIVSNDSDVQRWFGKIIWVLVMHGQFLVAWTNASALFIPMGKSTLSIVVTYVCFYLIACPVTVIVALTDMVTNSVLIKLTCCLATTPMAAVLIAMFAFGYLGLMDWSTVAKIINDRANSDKDEKSHRHLNSNIPEENSYHEIIG